MFRILIFILAAAALLTACGAKPRAAQPDPLPDTSWLLDTLGGQPPVAETAITLNFAAGDGFVWFSGHGVSPYLCLKPGKCSFLV